MTVVAEIAICAPDGDPALASALGSEIADGRETPRGAEIGPSSAGAAREAVSAADGGCTTTTGVAATAGGSPTTLT